MGICMPPGSLAMFSSDLIVLSPWDRCITQQKIVHFLSYISKSQASIHKNFFPLHEFRSSHNNIVLYNYYLRWTLISDEHSV